jgi:hypothetical protein
VFFLYTGKLNRNLPTVTGTDSLKFAVCVTFFYVEERLCFLKKTCSEFPLFAPQVKVVIVTNAQREEHLSRIRQELAGLNLDYEIFQAQDSGHPFFLPWAHFIVFRRMIDDPSFTHFLYVEDDIYISKTSIDYWMREEQVLRPRGLIPSFFRYELKTGSAEKYSSDMAGKISIRDCPQVILSPEKGFFNAPNPYQGVYFLPRDLMKEHLDGPSSNPDHRAKHGPIWNIREKAAQGLTWTGIPRKFNSRNVVGYNPRTYEIDEEALIQHLPANYANYWDSALGKIKISDLLSDDVSWDKRYRFGWRVLRYVTRKAFGTVPK